MSDRVAVARSEEARNVDATCKCGEYVRIDPLYEQHRWQCPFCGRHYNFNVRVLMTEYGVPDPTVREKNGVDTKGETGVD